MDSVQHHRRTATSDSGQFLRPTSLTPTASLGIWQSHLMQGVMFVQATIEAGLIPPLINILQKVGVCGSTWCKYCHGLSRVSLYEQIHTTP